MPLGTRNDWKLEPDWICDLATDNRQRALDALKSESVSGVGIGRTTWGLTSTETTRLISDGEKGEREYGGGGDYIPVATPSPPE